MNNSNASQSREQSTVEAPTTRHFLIPKLHRWDEKSDHCVTA